MAWRKKDSPTENRDPRAKLATLVIASRTIIHEKLACCVEERPLERERERRFDPLGETMG